MPKKDIRFTYLRWQQDRILVR